MNNIHCDLYTTPQQDVTLPPLPSYDESILESFPKKIIFNTCFFEPTSSSLTGKLFTTIGSFVSDDFKNRVEVESLSKQNQSDPNYIEKLVKVKIQMNKPDRWKYAAELIRLHLLNDNPSKATREYNSEFRIAKPASTNPASFEVFSNGEVEAICKTIPNFYDFTTLVAIAFDRSNELLYSVHMFDLTLKNEKLTKEHRNYCELLLKQNFQKLFENPDLDVKFLTLINEIGLLHNLFDIPKNPIINRYIGMVYAYAIGVEKDFRKAFIHFNAAARAKDPVALYEMGKIYESGSGVEMDRDRALYLYEESANLQNLGAVYKLGLFAERKGDFTKAVKSYRWGDLKDHPASTYRLSLCYERGHGVVENRSEADRLFSKAVSLDHPEALYRDYHRMYKTDCLKAFRALKRAADFGHPKAQELWENKKGGVNNELLEMSIQLENIREFSRIHPRINQEFEGEYV